MALVTQHPLLHHPKNLVLGFFRWGEPHTKVVVSLGVRFFFFPTHLFFSNKISYLFLLPTYTLPTTHPTHPTHPIFHVMHLPLPSSIVLFYSCLSSIYSY